MCTHLITLRMALMSSMLPLYTSCRHMQGQTGGSLRWPALCTLQRAVNCTSPQRLHGPQYFHHIPLSPRDV